MHISRLDVLGPLKAGLASSPLAPHAEFLKEIASELLFLHEEDRIVRPVLLVSLSRDTTAETMAHGLGMFGLANELHELVLPADAPSTAKYLLKQIAPLSSGTWLPCIELFPRPRVCLLRRPRLDIHSMVDTLRTSPPGTMCFVKNRDGHLRAYAENQEIAFLADPRAPVDRAGAPLRHFYPVVCRQGVASPLLAQRFGQVLESVIEQSHGLLLAVTRAPDTDCFDAFSSFVRVEPPIDLHGGDQREPTAAGTMRISAILRAVTSMDGIVVLGPNATIRAYRCFVKIVGSKQAAGGARALAFQAIQEHREFEAALLHSQDGQTLVRVWDVDGTVTLSAED